jgi:hypothetical protein
MVWLLMAGMAGLVLSVAALLAKPGPAVTDVGRPEMLLLIAAIFACVYGLACGARLLAGRRDQSTPAAIPGRTLWQWGVRSLIGLALVLAYCAALAAILAALRLLPAAQLLLVLPVAGLFGLGWALPYSARASTAFNALGRSLIGLLLLGPAILLVPEVLPETLGSDQVHSLVRQGWFWLVLALALTGLGFVRSALILRRRGQRPSQESAGWEMLLGALLTRAWRRRWVGLALVLFALAGGLLNLAAPTILWPILTLALGVLCGSAMFAREKAGRLPFLRDDPRFSLGRVWRYKLAVSFLFAILLTLLAAVPMVVAAARDPNADDRHGGRLNPLFADRILNLLAPDFVYLSAWLLTGFAFGQLCGLLFKRRIIAVLSGVLMSLAAVAVWLPSLAARGPYFWQAAVVPLLALLTVRLLLPAWAAGCLASRGTTLRLGTALVLALVWLAAYPWYRVAEIRDVPEPEGLAGFETRLSAAEQERGGRLMRAACENLRVRQAELAPMRPTRALFPGGGPQAEPMDFPTQVVEVLVNGWPRKEPELGGWLQRLAEDVWREQLTVAAALPLGLVEDPRGLTWGSPPRFLDAALTAGQLLAARGLQLQARGHEDDFPQELKVTLALARGIRHYGCSNAVLTARRIEHSLHLGLFHWLEGLNSQPELLRETLELLRRHEAELPTDPADRLRADYLIARNTIADPAGWLAAELRRGRRSPPAKLPPTETAVVTLAWHVPWERTRLERLVRTVYQPGWVHSFEGLGDATWVCSWTNYSLLGFVEVPKADLARLRADQLCVALRWYQVEKGQPARALAELVPDFLPAVPADPYDGRPYRYRLSEGEPIEYPSELVAGSSLPSPGDPRWVKRFVPAGQGVLWSVGLDGTDDGGHRFGSPGQMEHTDRIYLVPLPPKR